MCSHDPQLQGFLVLVGVGVALRKNRPSRSRARLDTDDFLHDTDGLWKVIVDVGLISIANKRSNLLRQGWPNLPAFLKNR
jgi:hypothetical protein